MIHRAINPVILYTHQEIFGKALQPGNLYKWLCEPDAKPDHITVDDVVIADFCIKRRNQIPKNYKYVIDTYLMQLPNNACHMFSFINLGFSKEDLSKLVSKHRIEVPDRNARSIAIFRKSVACMLYDESIFPIDRSDPPRFRQVKNKNVKKSVKPQKKQFNNEGGKKLQNNTSSYSKRTELRNSNEHSTNYDCLKLSLVQVPVSMS